MSALCFLGEHQQLMRIARYQERVGRRLALCDNALGPVEDVRQHQRAHPTVAACDRSRRDVYVHRVTVDIRRVERPVVVGNAAEGTASPIGDDEAELDERANNGIPVARFGNQQVNVVREPLYVARMRQRDSLPEHHHEGIWMRLGKPQHGFAFDLAMLIEYSLDVRQRDAPTTSTVDCRNDSAGAALLPRFAIDVYGRQVVVGSSELTKEMREDPMVQERPDEAVNPLWRQV